MPGLTYPFAFTCVNCDQKTVVERSDARGLSLNPDSLNAVSIVLQQRGWLQDEIDGRIFCPDCTGGLSSD
jgi:hypothetical protein